MLNFMNNKINKIYECSVCKRIDTPIIYHYKTIRELGWRKIDGRWVCRSCANNKVQSRKQIVHYNKTVKHRIERLKNTNKRKITLDIKSLDL